MGGSISGLSSGLDTESIVSGLMGIKRQQIDRLTEQKDTEAAKKNTWGAISSNALSLQLSSYTMSRPSTYNLKTATVSDPDALDVVTTTAAINGNYTFHVNQLATAHQLSTNGYKDYDETPVGAGTITLEMGAGDVDNDTELNMLNGGDGITRGSIKITDRDNNSATIDLSSAMYIDDVMNAINSASGISVTAALNSAHDGVDLTYSGSGTNNLKVEEVSGGSTAIDLGILGDVASATLSGSNVYKMTTSTGLDLLNDGLGIREQSFILNDGEGSGDLTISLTTAKTLDDVITTINDTAGLAITASISTDGKSIALAKDSGSNNITVTENSYSTAADLGLLSLTASTGGDGDDVYSGMNTVFLDSINGGNGITGTSFDIDATTISIAGKVDVLGVMDAINAQTGTTNVAARYNDSKNGLELYSTNSSSFTVTEDASTTAADLGILGTADSDYELRGTDLDIKYIGRNTVLDEMRMGSGVRKGTIKITATDGDSFSLNLDTTSIKTIGDVMDQINTIGISYNVTAAINSTGDGLLISDSNGGAENLSVADVDNGHMAEDLGIEATTSGTSIDGSLEQSIAVSSSYTLEDVRDAINDLDMDMKASIINDGSSSPYRLVVSSTMTGHDGRIVLGSDISGLSMNTASDAQDSVVVMGNPTSENAVFIANNTNTISNFITGLTLNLKDTSSSLIQVTINTDADTLIDFGKDFVNKFNKTLGTINEQLRYDSATGTTKELFGDTSLLLLQQQVYDIVNREVSGLSGDISTMVDVGIKLGLDGALTLDETTFKSVLQNNLDDVIEFFTYQANRAVESTATASSTDASWTTNGGIDGNSALVDYADGSTGWKNATDNESGLSYELDFGSEMDFSNIMVYGVDTDASDIIKSFDLDYWDSTTSAWETFKSITNNTSKDVSIYFPTGISTSKFRLNDMVGTDSRVRMLDFQAYEPLGLAALAEYELSKVTDISTGILDSSLDGIEDSMDVLDEEILSLSSRLDIEEDRMRAKFVELEKMMGSMNQTSSWLSQQTSTLNNVWNYKG